MFENIVVIPVYMTVLEITDSEKGMTWEQQVYLGTDYKKAYELASKVVKIKSKAVIRHYHIRADGTMEYIMEEEV